MGFCSGFLIVLDDAVNCLVERDQQRHVARDDLGQHAHGGADLRIAAFVGEQTSQDFFSNRVLGGIQRAVSAAL